MFPNVSQIEKLIIQARKLLPGITIVSWPEYKPPFSKDLTEPMETVNTYELLEKTIENPCGSASGNKSNGSASGDVNTGNSNSNTGTGKILRYST